MYLLQVGIFYTKDILLCCFCNTDVIYTLSDIFILSCIHVCTLIELTFKLLVATFVNKVFID